MNRLKMFFRPVFIHLIRFGGVIICLIFPPAMILAAGPANYASDIAPPQITIVSPPKDSRMETGTPLIEILFADFSGINNDTIHLFVDRMEVTAGATIEQEDVTGQDAGSPWRISYTPEVALSKGVHEVRFGVEDLAGNLAELGWSFEVTVGDEAGIEVSGSNTLRIDKKPVEMITDTIDLTARGQYGETGIRFNMAGKITDYPGAEPAYTYDNYNFYYDDYSLGFYHRKSSAVFGNVNASLDSELLQIGLRMYDGAVAENTFERPGGQYHWTVFSGDSGSSYGTGAAVYQMTGVGGDWRVKPGMQIGGYYVGLEGRDLYRFAGLRGNTFIDNLGLIRFEIIHGSLETNDTSGEGWILHWDKSPGNWNLGLDYTELEPEYPNVGASRLFNSTDGGARSYGAHISAAINEVHNFNVDGSISRNNLDHSQASTKTRRNIAAGYAYSPDSDWSLNAGYQGDFQHQEKKSDNEDWEDHVVRIGMRQNIGDSQLNLTGTLGEGRDPDPSDTYDQVQLLASWTKPFGPNNLTPSLQWSDQSYEDGDCSDSIEVRLTWDRKFYHDLPRSSIGLFYRVNDKIENGVQTRLITFGVLPSVYFKTGPNSILTLVYHYSDWTREISEERDGIDRTINLTWKLVFY